MKFKSNDWMTDSPETQCATFFHLDGKGLLQAAYPRTLYKQVVRSCRKNFHIKLYMIVLQFVGGNWSSSKLYGIEINLYATGSNG